MEKGKHCNHACKEGKHFWKAKLTTNYSARQNKTYHSDWLCPKCNKIIFGTKQECFKCKTLRPNIGDWYCQYHENEKCGELNFGKNTRCKKCNHAKFCWDEK
jgi:hypothetical protein